MYHRRIDVVIADISHIGQHLFGCKAEYVGRLLQETTNTCSITIILVGEVRVEVVVVV